MRTLTRLILFILILTTFSPVFAAEAKLTVTATVEGSVGIVLDRDGQWKIQVANLPNPSDRLAEFVNTQAAKSQNSLRPAKPLSSKSEKTKRTKVRGNP